MFLEHTMFAAIRPRGRPLGATSQSRLMPWHHSLVDFLIANPGSTYKDAAYFLGRTPQAVYLTTKTDSFRALYSERRRELSEVIKKTTAQSLQRITKRSLQELERRLDDQEFRENMGHGHLLDTAELALKATGFIGASKNTPPVEVNVGVQVQAAVLAEAKETLREINVGPIPQLELKKDIV